MEPRDFSALVTILGVFIANASLVIPLFLWNRSESRADMRHLDAKLDVFRNETQALINAIRQDMQDFHGRLCAIEERNRK